MEHLFLSLLLLFVSLVSLSLFLLFHRHRSHFAAAGLPPGTVGYPLLGETLEFLSGGRKGCPDKFVTDRMVAFSSAVIKTSLMGERAALFCGPACNKFLFSNENKLVAVWWPASVGKVFLSSTESSTQSAAMMTRKLVPEFLKPQAMRSCVAAMDSLARRHFASEWDGRREVVTFPLTKRYTFAVAAKVFLSLEDPASIAVFEEPFQDVAGGIVSMPINLPGTLFRRAIKASEFIRKELGKIIRQRKADLAVGKASPTQDILSHMLLACTDDGRYLSELCIADKILGLIVGGHDTGSSLCTLIAKFLAEYPDVYEAVYREQMEIAKSKAEGELLDWEDLQRMKYSWNVAQEVLRLAPPVQGAFREAMSDFVFNGFSIPKGWKLYWSTSSTHNDATYFPDPEKFDPTRFEGSGPPPYTYVPFGGGPRMCPGKEYARLEILVFMHNLVKRYKWEMVIKDEKIIVDPLPIPAKGLPIRLFPH